MLVELLFCPYTFCGTPEGSDLKKQQQQQQTNKQVYFAQSVTSLNISSKYTVK